MKKILALLIPCLIFIVACKSDLYTQYIVIFDTKGGTNIEPQIVTNGETVQMPADPERNGYEFDGWYIDDLYSKLFDFSSPIVGNTTIYAKWNVIQYKIEYNLKGGEGELNPSYYTIETDTFKLSNPTKEDSIFLGWIERNSNQEPILDVSIEKGSTGDKYFTACWSDIEKPTYTITYHKNRSPEESFSVAKQHGVPFIIGSADKFLDDDFIFHQWNTQPNGSGISFDKGDEYLIDDNLDLYAIWYQDGTDLLEFKSNGDNTCSVVGIKDGKHVENIIIPSIYNGEKVTSIRREAFQECTSLISVEIPESVTSIGCYAFEDCSSLTSVEIPGSVTIIELRAFAGCTSLSRVVISEGVSTIEQGAFQNCISLSSLEISGSVTSIGERAFVDCHSLNSVKIPGSVTSIGELAFMNCTGLQSVIILDGVTNIGDSAFLLCTRLTSVEIPESVTSIGESAFQGCTNLNSVEIPESVTSIGESAFYSCESLQSIEIPDGVTSIKSHTFLLCSNLSNVTIPGSVISIENEAFGYCSKLSRVEYSGSIADWNKIEKAESWKNGCPNFIVKCIDETIE